MSSTRRLTVAALAAALSVGVAATRSAPGAVAAQTPITTTTRLWGADRYATAVAVSQRAFSRPLDLVVIASGEDFPDALTAGAFAARANAPLLLTRKRTLPSVVRAELRRLNPDRIYVVGGPGAVSRSVLTELDSTAPLVSVARISGADRYATAEAVARTTSETEPHGVMLVSGETYADVPSAGIAAVVAADSLLLTAQATLPPATQRALTAFNRPNVTLVGGTAAISAAVEAQVQALLPQAKVRRIAGADRYETAALLMDDAFAGQPPGIAFYVSGTSFADALAAIPAAKISRRPLGEFGAPVLPTRATCHPTPTWDWAQRIKPRVAVGGPAVVYGGTAHC